MSDMTDEQILAPLRTEPPGPPKIDVPRAMAEGARRRRHRQWASGPAIAVAVALVATGGVVTGRRHAAPDPAATTPPPKSCTVATLPTGDGSRTDVLWGDPSGYLLGEQLPKGGNWSRPIVWKNGVIVSNPGVPAGYQVFVAINDHGVAVGSSMYDLVYQAYVMRGGASDASGINDSGVIVGYVGHNSAPTKLDGVPVRWPSSDAAPQRLAFATGWQFGEADGIADDGTVWGRSGG
jgi:hypothetical protein